MVVSQTTNVGETFEFLWEVVLIEYRIGTVLDNLQRHGAKHRGELVYALRPGKKKRKRLKEWRKKGNMDHGSDANVGKFVFQKMAVHGTT